MNNPLQRRKSDQLPARVGGFFHRFFFMIGVAAFISVFFFALTLSKMMNYMPPELPEKILLTYTFSAGLGETATKPSLSQPLLRPSATLNEVVSALRAAADDARVKGLAVKVEDPDFNLAQVQELRDAVAAFRAAGKFAYVYSDSFGGMSGGMGDYYLASAFGEVWLQPVGAVAIGGISTEVPFLKGFFDKIGVKADFVHKGIYKSAPESLTESGMTAPTREMTEGMIGDLSQQIMADIAADRKIDPASFAKMVDMAPLTDKEAVAMKLVDQIGYADELMANARKKAGVSEKDPVDLLRYSFIRDTRSLNKGMSGFIAKFVRKDAPASAHKDKAKIALIYGVGDIIPYSGKARSGFGEGGMAANKITAAFKAAQKDEDVAAVVFRIDSPGGEPSAAESIRRAILQTRAKGKPVIVSMGGAAASGGYWVAAPADKIVAQPATLTGSIGVFGGKFVMRGLMEKLGINFERIARGRNAAMWSSTSSFTPQERARFDALLSNIYDAFLERVMEGRKMTREQALSVAEGRVWTGRQAKDNGLVDAIGGIDTAVRLAKLAAKIDLAQDVPVVNFPPRKSTLELFISLASEGVFFRPDYQVAVRELLSGLQETSIQLK